MIRLGLPGWEVSGPCLLTCVSERTQRLHTTWPHDENDMLIVSDEKKYYQQEIHTQSLPVEINKEEDSSHTIL